MVGEVCVRRDGNMAVGEECVRWSESVAVEEVCINAAVWEVRVRWGESIAVGEVCVRQDGNTAVGEECVRRSESTSVEEVCIRRTITRQLGRYALDWAEEKTISDKITKSKKYNNLHKKGVQKNFMCYYFRQVYIMRDFRCRD